MVGTLLVPLDGSPLAERALPFATRLAASGAGALVLAHVASPATDANSYDLSAVADRLRAEGFQVLTRLLDAPRGVPAALDALARDLPADLVVMSTHGRGGLRRTIFGSVADGLVRRTATPVLLIPPGCKQSWPEHHPGLFLVPLDGSDLAEQALGPARQLAARFDAELLLVRVLSPVLHTRYRTGKLVLASAGFDEVEDAWHYLSEHADRLRTAGQRVSIWVLVGSPAAAIAEAARTEHADAIVMTTHGRHGAGRLLLGSTADGILQRTGLPVLLVPPRLGGRAASAGTDMDATRASGDRGRSLTILA
jgi:nucleotide-binding universal stress UspA family protein